MPQQLNSVKDFIDWLQLYLFPLLQEYCVDMNKESISGIEEKQRKAFADERGVHYHRSSFQIYYAFACYVNKLRKEFKAPSTSWPHAVSFLGGEDLSNDEKETRRREMSAEKILSLDLIAFIVAIARAIMNYNSSINDAKIIGNLKSSALRLLEIEF